MLNIDTNREISFLFGQDSRWLKISFILMFLLATLIRMNELHAPGHLLDREYTSAIFSRAYYFTNNTDVAKWERDIAIVAKNQQPILEPPVLEYLVSVIYRIVGREDLVFSRYLTNAFWLVGGVFMFLIVRRLLSIDEAFIATSYYLFVPMGVIISRSFQPDSLMMMLFLISLYLMVLYFDEPTTKRLFGAALLTGITLLLRPLVIFAVFCAFLAFSIYHNQGWRKVFNLPLITFGFISLLPSLIYYGYSILFAGFMRWKISTSFMPYLLIKKGFWLGWWNNVVNVGEFTPLLLSIIGFFFIKNKKVQYLIVGLAVAFLMFSMAFTYHIHTHPYYHIQIFPIVAFCIAPFSLEVVKVLKQNAGSIWWVPVITVSIFAVIASYSDVRESLYSVHAEDPSIGVEIGNIIHHSPRTVFVSYYYGLPLEYYGEFGGAPWPVRIEDEFYRRPGERELSVQERIAGLGFDPEYFVITHFELFNRHHQDLQVFLDENCNVLAQTDSYLIYDSCKYLDFAVNKLPTQVAWRDN